MAIIQKKVPKQLRSKAVVKSILDAATEQLLSHGMKNLTTNHIAQKAGVNIASLYQYFDDKEAIVARLIELHVEEEIERISSVVAKITEISRVNNEALISKGNIRLIISARPKNEVLHMNPDSCRNSNLKNVKFHRFEAKTNYDHSKS